MRYAYMGSSAMPANSECARHRGKHRTTATSGAFANTPLEWNEAARRDSLPRFRRHEHRYRVPPTLVTSWRGRVKLCFPFSTRLYDPAPTSGMSNVGALSRAT